MTPVSAPPVDGVVARLLATAQQHADDVAVLDGTHQIGYGQLVAEAQHIATAVPHHAGPLVGLALGRSWRAIAAMIGVLMTGRAYVPIDPTYPEARRAYIEADARLDTVLSDGADGNNVRARTVRPDAPAHDVTADAMYVMYTSGSTGDPKGVVITQANLLALIDGCAEAVPITTGQRWSVFHSFSFDFSVWEIWGCLLSGGCAVLVDRVTAFDPQRMLELLKRTKVEVLSIVPSAFGGLVQAAERTGLTLPKLGLVVFGGEAIRAHDVEHWWRSAVAPSAELINMYGITETTVHVTAGALTPDRLAAAAPGRTPIGRPLPHLQVLITDAGGALVPDGTVGELVVTGTGVAAGYLGRPELTEQRFRPLVGGLVGYRSGDLAVRDAATDELFYAGRGDDQVKIRGHRVELGEIEAVLVRHPDIAAAACVCLHEPGRPDRLFACLVPAGADTEPAAVRRWLTQQVPSYLVPTRLFLVENLPLTASGKLDRAEVAATARTLVADLR
jgi:nonribosomal peptide synthetase DhbF